MMKAWASQWGSGFRRSFQRVQLLTKDKKKSKKKGYLSGGVAAVGGQAGYLPENGIFQWVQDHHAASILLFRMGFKKQANLLLLTTNTEPFNKVVVVDHPKEGRIVIWGVKVAKKDSLFSCFPPPKIIILGLTRDVPRKFSAKALSIRSVGLMKIN